ncbi:MAG: rod shape-determining protein MreC [Gammaproteobacteria bacterium]
MAVISIALMVFSHQMVYLQNMRSQLSLVVLPLQYVVDKPMKFINWVQNSFTTQQEVLEENAQLRARELLLQARLQRLMAIEHENMQLHALMSSSSHLTGRVLVAQILDAALDPLNQEIALDKGTQDGVFIGQPVLDAYGVIGQVIDATARTSRVLLVSDGRSAIPVQNNRNGMRGIVAGTGYANALSMLHLPNTADVKVGDYLVTSGLGGRFPFGYPVGQIVSIKKTSADRFAVIEVRPAAHVDKSRMVVLVWPANIVPAPQPQPAPAPTKAKAVKKSG